MGAPCQDWHTTSLLGRTSYPGWTAMWGFAQLTCDREYPGCGVKGVGVGEYKGHARKMPFAQISLTRGDDSHNYACINIREGQ